MIEMDRHLSAWRLGKQVFGFTATEMQAARGYLVGEAPGPKTDPRLPMFPYPPGSAAARLMGYAHAAPDEWLSRLRRANLFDEPGGWDLLAARKRAFEIHDWCLRPENYHELGPLRVLLLGVRVRDAWGLTKRDGRQGEFGSAELGPLTVSWIPHPSGRNPIYNDPKKQIRAGHFVQWAMGARSQP